MQKLLLEFRILDVPVFSLILFEFFLRAEQTGDRPGWNTALADDLRPSGPAAAFRDELRELLGPGALERDGLVRDRI